MFSKSVAFSIPSNPIYLPPANEVWAKVIFSEVCVKNSVHGGSSTWAGTPPWTRQVHPLGPDRYTPQTRQVHSLDQVHPPGTRQVQPPDQVHLLGPGRYTPQTRQVHPLGPGRYTPQPGTPPGTRQVHPPDQVPPGPGRYPPPAVHAGRYGQLAGGTHPTGMHSCFIQKNISTNNSAKFFLWTAPWYGIVSGVSRQFGCFYPNHYQYQSVIHTLTNELYILFAFPEEQIILRKETKFVRSNLKD